MTFPKNYYLNIIIVVLATFNNIPTRASYTHNEFIEKTIQTSDSLKTKTYNELIDLLYRNIQDTISTDIYAKIILDKGKKNIDTTLIADGYYFLAFNSKDKKKVLSYADSIIEITKNIKHRSYPACAYLLKADSYFFHRNFKDAFDNYIIALNLSKNKNDYIYYNSKHVIGLLKSRVGKDKEALEIFRECHNFTKNDSQKNENYLITLFSMSDSHMRNGNLDSAVYYNKKGFLISKELNNQKYVDYFKLNQGFNEFYKGNYSASMDSLQKSLSTVLKRQDRPNIACNYYYLGKSDYALGNEKKAIEYFKKVDSVFDILKDVHPEVRDGYTLLIEHYKKQNDVKNQLKYIEKLLVVDSVLNKNYKELISSLNKDFDTPLLLNDKNKLIDKLNNQQRYNKKWLWLLFMLLTTISVIFTIKIKKSKQQKTEFKKLIADLENQNKNDIIKASEKSAAISDHILKDLSEKLKEFESTNGFLDSDLNSNNLATKLQTNVKYLSKSIRHIYDKNFIDYLNDLRINYALNRLKNEPVFRNYTIKAIAEECGFKNPNSFSRAFVKITQIKPSIFIKNVEEITSNSRI